MSGMRYMDGKGIRVGMCKVFMVRVVLAGEDLFDFFFCFHRVTQRKHQRGDAGGSKVPQDP